MISELIRAFFLILAAEMGDKTQIIAMTFATQYKVREVLTGVFIGVFLNHGIAIVLGRYISKIIPMESIQLIAGIMFIVFGLITLKEEKLEDSKSKKVFGPIFTVALAFFVGELGDKTQLTAMTLSTEGNYPLFILIGTTLGMIATSGLGIFVGSKIGAKIPDIIIKVVSSIVFISFGTLKLYEWIPKEVLNSLYVFIYFLIILSIQIILTRKLVLIRGYERSSPLKEVAATLYIQTNMLNEAVADICLGEARCGNCSGSGCIIGYIKKLLKDARENEKYYIEENIDITKLIKKDFDRNKVVEALSLIIADYMKHGVIQDEKFIINRVRESLELILFGQTYKMDGNFKKYLKHINKTNNHIGQILEKKVRINLRVVN